MPVVALVLGHVEIAGGGAEGEALAGLVDVEGMAQDEVIAEARGQAAGKLLEGFPAVARARGYEAAVLRHAHFVLDRGHEPGLARLLGMNRDAKAEARTGILPFGQIVGAVEDAVMMLAPEMIRPPATLHEEMRVLDRRIIAPVRGPVFGQTDHGTTSLAVT